MPSTDTTSQCPHRTISAASALLTLVILSITGCASMTPGELTAVRVDSDKPRVGNVYLLRGWIGIFSFGINNLGTEINQNGVRANIYQDSQWAELAVAIRQKYTGKNNPEPLILIGHSFGADDVLRVAKKLGDDHITVDLVVTLDPVTPPEVPSNVRHCYNLYQSNDLWDSVPMFRGVPLKLAAGSTGKLDNGDVRTNRVDLLEPGTDHFNIEKKQKVHADVIRQVVAACPPRDVWVMAHRTTPGLATISARPALSPVDVRRGDSLHSENIHATLPSNMPKQGGSIQAGVNGAVE